MSEYTLPSGLASIETEGGILSEINYRYPATGKDKTIQELLEQCLDMQATITELKGLLGEAKCPCCDGGGAYYDNYGEVCQCQWCFETKAALKQEDV